MAARNLAFILAATDHGPMTLNRLDYCRTADGAEYGVGLDILRTGSYPRTDTDLLYS